MEKLHQITKTFRKKQPMSPIFLHVANLAKLVISYDYQTIGWLSESYRLLNLLLLQFRKCSDMNTIIIKKIVIFASVSISCT